MVDENELRAHLFSSEQPPIAIDTEAIVSRSRARRRPRQFAVGAVGVLAAASIVFTGVISISHTADLTSAGIMAENSETRMENDQGAGGTEPFLSPGEDGAPTACGAVIPTEAESPFGLTLTLELADRVAASGSTTGSVRLTNTSSATVTGTTAAVPDMNLIRDKIIISHSPDVQILSVVPVDLQPGQSIEFDVFLDIYDCTTIDSGGMVAPGTYNVSTSLAFVPTEPDDGDTAVVRSPLSSIVLY